MRFLRLLLIVFLAGGISSCAALRRVHIGKKKKETPRAEAVRPDPERVGTITLVNEEDRFVLVDIGSRAVPAAGTALKVFGEGTEPAVLSVGDVRRRPFIVGDIVKGTPRKGDAVFK